MVDYLKDVVFEEVLPEKKPEYGSYEFRSKRINLYLKRNDIKLYTHQAKGFRSLLDDNKNIVVTTPTASGKSLIYTLTILEKIEIDSKARAILLFPLIALANDQYEKIKNLIDDIGIKATVSVFTGATDENERRKIKDQPPNILITTPDMLHIGILPNHRIWSDILSNLQVVVIDELHSYRGILGSHVANVIKRLKRLVYFYKGDAPQFILNSATIKNPTSFSKKFIGEDVSLVSDSGAESVKRIVRIFKNISKNKVSHILIDLLKKNIPTLVFVDSRKEVELLYLRLKDILEKERLQHLKDFITPYRSGYTSKERREIEKKLKKGEYKLVISTSALEMGIDIGSIDACVLVGFPGTLSSMWQRFGRAGRRKRTAYNILIPKRDILDQYFLKNPQDILIKDIEEPVINPENPYILKKHLLMMAKEKPIELSELKGKTEKYYIRELILDGELYLRDSKIYAKKVVPFGLRSSSGQFSIVDQDDGRVVGTMNQELVIYEAYKNAIYIHNGESYVIKSVDFDVKNIYISKTAVRYFTDPLTNTEINIVNVEKSIKFKEVELFYGDVDVKSQVIGFSKRDIGSYERMEDVIFEDTVYIRNFPTKALWFTMPQDWEVRVLSLSKHEKIIDLLKFLEDVGLERSRLEHIRQVVSDPSFKLQKINDILDGISKNLFKKMGYGKERELEDFTNSTNKISEVYIGGLHGSEHSMIGIFSIIAMNDRWDIGGVSTPFHHQTGKPTIFIYDGFEGGIGYSEKGFERFKELVDISYKNVSNCGCLNGCPSCILSPKCGNGNEFLDKAGTKVLLSLLRENLTS